MSSIESLCVFALIGLLLATSLGFRALRRPTKDYADGRAYKARLAGWVKTFEGLVWLVLFAGGLVAIFWLEAGLRRWAGLAGRTEGAPAVFTAVGVALAWLPLALLLANGVSWLIPPLRRANLSAMEGSPMSFARLNGGLIKMALVTVPVGLILMVVGTLDPWTR